ncbi:Plasmid stabilisation system protein [Pseudomonas sp. 24 E 13]|jgi:toxin ParE1/3/4|uniref:type II toxin-antitoxin system RelE/ParE family toxin n=1 Tax=Pseudomonas TaxID=286 RepID=UPI0008128D65|nr:MULTISPECIES: type II toxin-antitoxin system RelE/ParE family toxin [unclassified Pseudomonas]MBY8932578.1 type II toxin-antitoxin system RelE/ParE family toxin [Pseudomonas sp. Wu6]CRM24561.1 Plasmid stabilisation system protein [Pseudomonas sp. 24 E 13]CRM78769.1 Plasmid stabilisation system protein [Pseudomonas sp. 44 R 15]CRN03403.1 Plasmid stabilisation system protein [Pseudomonas sp. 34 E 7]
MPHYRISDAARGDIVDILRHSQMQFGESARKRYQTLILTTLQTLAKTPHHVASRARDEIAPGLRSYHLSHSRQHANPRHATVKNPRHIVFYRLAHDKAVEVVRCLHDAMDVQLHLPDE